MHCTHGRDKLAGQAFPDHFTGTTFVFILQTASFRIGLRGGICFISVGRGGKKYQGGYDEKADQIDSHVFSKVHSRLVSIFDEGGQGFVTQKAAKLNFYRDE